LTSAGIEVWLIFEADGKELLGGAAAGKNVAVRAETCRLQQGIPAKPIYFNVDFDAQLKDFPVIFEALDAIAAEIGIERVGLYAGYKVIQAAFDAGKIRYGFQTYAWSGGKWDSRAHLQQWSNGQWGGSVDFTRAIKSEYRQSPIEQK